MQDYHFQAHDLEHTEYLHSQASLPTISPVTARSTLTLTRETLPRDTLFDLDSNLPNTNHLRVSGVVNLRSFPEVTVGDSSISPVPLPNCVWEDSAATQLLQRMSPIQKQRSPTPVNMFRFSTQSPNCKKQTCGSRHDNANGSPVKTCTWSGFDSGADLFSNASFECSPRVSSNANITTPVEPEVLLGINFGCGLLRRLPWFQLLDVMEQPG